jgi:hypothetical protein
VIVSVARVTRRLSTFPEMSAALMRFDWPHE